MESGRDYIGAKPGFRYAASGLHAQHEISRKADMVPKFLGKVLKRISLTMFLTITTFASSSIMANEDVKPPISNIGFIKKAPKEMKEKFPMCDEFLKVEWIDREKAIGSTAYDVYMDGKKYSHVPLAMVHLDRRHPRYDYDLQKYRQHGELNDVLSLIKQGEVFFAFNYSNLSIRQKQSDGAIVEEEFTTVADALGVERDRLSLADGRATVCIPYPDNQRMYLAEVRQINKLYSPTEVTEVLAELNTWIPEAGFFNEAKLIDVNFDQKVDYFNGVNIAYSQGNKYFLLQQKTLPMGKEAEISPTNHKSCEVSIIGGLYWTTDGSNFYLNNECNVTELTTAK